MSLLDEFMEGYVLQDKKREPDGYGGVTETWSDSVTFEGAMVQDTSIEARSAAASGLTSTYTLTTKRNMVLQYGDHIRRISDGKLFRVTSDGREKKSPLSANIDARQVTCEELRHG